jgi:hypothetical protein
VSDAAANLLSFVPSLGTREVLAFGEGIALPTRMRFKEVPPQHLPRGESGIAARASDGNDINFVASVVERWRGATTHHSNVGNDSIVESKIARVADAPMTQPAMGLDPERFKLLKKPLS